MPANHWNCKSCGSNQYSAANHSDKAQVECLGCGEKIDNPYYRRDEDEVNCTSQV